MKKQLDIPKELSTRKYKRPPFIIHFLYRNILHVLYRKFHPHFKWEADIRKQKGPAFVIFNHLSRLDHYYVTEMCYPRRINILAGYNEFYRSHLHTVFKLNQIIPKRQYTANDFVSMKNMMSVINQKGIIAFAPEGLASNDGMNKPIVPHTGHMFKHFKIPVYFVELRGEYLQNTKVCLDERYGETYATMKLLFSPEDLEKLSVEEIDDKINNAFRGDEYVWQKEHRIKWDTRGRVCYHLEDMLFCCPKCKSMLQMKSTDTTIYCENCGNGASMDDYYDFHPFDEKCVIPDTPSRWVDFERVEVIKQIRDPNFQFKEEVSIGRLPKDHYVTDLKTSEVVSQGTLTIDHSGFKFEGKDTKDYDFNLTWNALFTAITELDLTYINIYVGNEYTDIFPKGHSSYYIYLLIEELHRYHVNFYKNFKWNDWMYEGVVKTLSEDNH